MMADSELLDRLVRLESIEAIRQLKFRYFHACDHKQVDVIRSCFAEGPIDLDYGRIGRFTDREEMLAVFSELACQEHIVEMHHGQNPQITILDAQSAKATWGLYYFLIDTRREVVTQLGGVYDDEYRCVEGEWLIVGSHYRVTSTQIFALGEGVAQVIFAGRSAPVELDDPNEQAG